MASIALVTFDTAHAAATRAKAALEANGHTVTFVTTANFNTHDFSPYGLVATVRTDAANVSGNAASIANLIAAGKPLLLDFAISGGTDGASQDVPTTILGMTGQALVESTTTEITLINNTHPVTSGLTLGANTIHSTAGFGNGFSQNLSVSTYGENLLALGDDDQPTATYGTILALEAGTRISYGGGTNTSARVLVFPVYTGNTVSAFYNTLIGQAVTWLLGTDYPTEAVATVLRSYAVVAPPKDAVAAELLRAYAVVAPPATEISVSAFRAYAVLGEPLAPTTKKRRVQNVNFL